LETKLDKQNNKAIRRQCEEAKVEIREFEKIVTTSQGEPEVWMQVVTYFQRVFDVVDGLSDLLAEEKDRQGKNWHNEDYTEVCWNGQKYKFDKLQQASAVEYLWRNRRAREKSIGEAIGSSADNFRLIHIFRQKGKKTGMHPAWGTMIIQDGRGVFALAERKDTPKK
jgi:hypothetical protein